MKRYFLFLLFSVFSLTLHAQQDYLRKANREIIGANYKNAELQMKAYKAYLDSKKTNKNSDEYIKIEKKINRIQRAQNLSVTASNAMSGWTYRYCDSLILSTVGDEERAKAIISQISTDVQRAEGCYSDICSFFPEDTVSRNKRIECQQLLTFINDINIEELNAWQRALEENTLTAMTGFLEQYPAGSRAALAKSRIAEIEDENLWAIYLDNPTYENCKAYLSAFPEGIHSSKANEDFLPLEENWYWTNATDRHKVSEYIEMYPTGMYLAQAKEKLAQIDEMDFWNNLNVEGTKESYKAYLKRYPDGRFATDASTRIAQIEFKEETDFWNARNEEGTKDAYNSYLKKYPLGKYASSAKSEINKIDDRSYWNTATSLDTKSSYQEYLAQSPILAYKSEAEQRIAHFLHLENMDADARRWESIKSSTDPKVFYTYINEASPFKADENLRCAHYNYNIYSAIQSESAQERVSFIESAMLFGTLSDEMKSMYDSSREEILYNAFISDKTQRNARIYLDNYSNRASEVNHLMCIKLADSMTISSSLESLRAAAMKYAMTKKDIEYVDNRYSSLLKDKMKQEKKREKYLASSTKKSSTSRVSSNIKLKEPFHFKMGLEFSYAGENLLTAAPLMTFGGHSNRFNMEFGYNVDLTLTEEDELIYIPSLLIRPRLNIVKLKYRGTAQTKRKGKDYSRFYMYLAPEVYLGPMPSMYGVNTSLYDWGGRLGFGIAPFDFFAGYRVNSQSAYLGIALYFGRK